MPKPKLLGNSDGMGKPVLILLIVLSVLVVGGIGYAIGKNKAEDDAQAKANQQLQTLQTQLDEANAKISGAVDQGQATVEQGQQTVESLQAENAQLKSTNEQLTAQVAALQKQLDEANSGGTTPPPSQ